jgi:hypothetical protein
MRSVPKKIGLKTDCGQSWNNDALINLWKAKATIATATSVSGSDQIVHVLLKTLEHSPKNTSVSRTGIFHQSRDDSVPGTLRSV